MIRPPAEILLELEQACLTVDRAIVERNWHACEVSWQHQRKLTHELDLSLVPFEPGSRELQLARQRIERIRSYRDGQLRRLTSFHDAIGKRLATIGRFNKMTKQRDPERRSSVLDVSS